MRSYFLDSIQKNHNGQVMDKERFGREKKTWIPW